MSIALEHGSSDVIELLKSPPSEESASEPDAVPNIATPPVSTPETKTPETLVGRHVLQTVGNVLTLAIYGVSAYSLDIWIRVVLPPSAFISFLIRAGLSLLLGGSWFAMPRLTPPKYRTAGRLVPPILVLLAVRLQPLLAISNIIRN